MAPTLEIPATITALQALSKQPYELGLACSRLLTSISSLVSHHLDHTADFHNNPVKASLDTSEFTASIDAYMKSMRTTDNVTEPFPDDLAVDRKQRRPRRKYQTKYSGLIEKMYKGVLRQQLKGVLLGYNVDATRLFNKGVDFGLNYFAWRLYPSANVVLEAGEEEWNMWLRVRCEELGKESIRKGYSALDDA